MYPDTNPQSRCPPQPFSPILGSMFLYFISYKRQHDPACLLARCGVQSSGLFVALWPTCIVLSRYVSSAVAFDWLSLRVSMCASAWTRRGPRVLPSPRIFMVLKGMTAAFVRRPPRDLGVRVASIVRCGLSCLATVDLNLDLYRLCGSLHGLDTFWARGLS